MKAAATSFWHVVVNASLLSKGILAASSLGLIACLFICIYKVLMLREKRQHVAKAQSLLQSSENFEDIASLGSVLKGTAPGLVIGRGLAAIKSLVGDSGARNLSPRDVTLLHDALDQALEEVAHKEYSYVPVISVTASIAPLVGLFGTISGLIQSFIAIGQQKTANIAVIAPGIAEALLTTFAGLVVAIPALVMYHYIQSRIGSFEHQLTMLSQRFEWVVKRLIAE